MNAIKPRTFRAQPPPHVHPLDPPIQHRAAAGFGKLLAMGLVEPRTVLPVLVDAAVAAGYSGDMNGIWVRLSHSMHQSARDWAIKRGKATWAIRQAVAPMFDARATPKAIRSAAFRENAARDEALLCHEVMDILRDEAEWFMRSRRPRRGT